MYFHAILKKVKEKSKWSGTCWSQNSKHSFTCIQFFDTILLKFILSWNELKTSSNTIDKILILLGRISYLCLNSGSHSCISNFGDVCHFVLDK
jgi:hypothetical protein